MRGMNMRDMKRRQQGLAPRQEAGAGKGTGRVAEEIPDDSDAEREPEGDWAEGVLVDRGDGVLVKRKGHCHSEETDYDLPDEAPPGWCGRDE